MYQITNRGDSTEVWLYDEIGWFGVTAKQFRADLSDITTPEINLRINSPGGDVFDGLAVFDALREHEAKVIVDVDSEASSIASVIAMGGDEVRMASFADMMIHNARGGTWGEPKDQEVFLNILRKKNDDIIDVYVNRTGLDRSEVADMMDATTWMSAEDAVDKGFADVVVDRSVVVEALWRDPERYPDPPKRVKDRMAAKSTESEKKTNVAWMRNIAKERLRLTKLRR